MQKYEKKLNNDRFSPIRHPIIFCHGKDSVRSLSVGRIDSESVNQLFVDFLKRLFAKIIQIFCRFFQKKKQAL